MKNHNELKQMHGVDYVQSYEQKASPKRLKRLMKHIGLNPNYMVADFACGNGLMMELVASHVKSYVGIDFSEPFIKAANKKRERLKIKNAKFICSDINSFCEKNKNKFNIGFAMDFSEHVYDEDWLNILKDIFSSLKENGTLYLHTPNAYFFMEIMRANNFIFKQLPEHIAVRTPEHSINLLKQVGFSRVNLLLIPSYTILRYIHFLSYLPIVGKYFKARIFIIATK